MMKQEETRYLPVKLTEDELAAKAQELAESVKEEEEQREAFAAWESTMKEAAKAKKAGIYLAHAETVRLGEIVETGVEEREVECVWLYSKSSAFLKRMDTGELVQVRDLRDDERQAVIGEAVVTQEPTLEDLTQWAGADQRDGKDGPEAVLADGSVVGLTEPEEAAHLMENFLREHVRS